MEGWWKWSGDWRDGQMIGHDEWTQRCGEEWTDRGVDSSRGAKPSLCNVLLVLTVNVSSLYCAETTGN